MQIKWSIVVKILGTQIVESSKVECCVWREFVVLSWQKYVHIQPLALLATCCMHISSFAYPSILKMEAKRQLTFKRITRHYISKDRTLHNHRCENLRSYTTDYCSFFRDLLQNLRSWSERLLDSSLLWHPETAWWHAESHAHKTFYARLQRKICRSFISTYTNIIATTVMY
jgi:hypothetical protein